MVRVALFAVLIAVLLLMLFRNKLNFSMIFITTISFAIVSFCAVIGLNMKSMPIFFAIHNAAIMLSTWAILYYMITKRYLLPVVLLPIFTLALYMATAYTSGAKDNILLG
ncbi:MAG: hypothetical protein KN64_14280 [Sulfurovum sp. AS07-7]|nr:MAG: hypothetical protein KN64_14280 [Sulfurovum sp. AS07-7]